MSGTGEPFKVQAIMVEPRPKHVRTALEPEEICSRLAAWADVAQVSAFATGTGSLAIWKSDLLNRLMYGGEKGPSRTPCPIHKGRWSGIQWGWPGSVWIGVDDDGKRTEKAADVDPGLQKWRDEGCRCSMHKGSSATTGWQPDEHCGCLESSDSLART